MAIKVLISLLVMTNLVNGRMVTTLSGRVRGELVQDVNATYYSYRGIPYAEPPIGHLRFMPPVPRRPWPGVLDALDYGPVCPQLDKVYKREQMSEDCLNLNVFVPHVPEWKPAPYPVLVYVHSGELLMLSGGDYIWGPQFYVKQGILVVTFNYRFGALGFLSLQTDEVSGNAGIKDAILALKWVKANIAAFGGDPENITLGGDSSGAVLVHCLLLTEKATNLFHRASMISGSILGYRFLNRHPVKSAKELGEKLGFQTEDLNELLQSLRNADAYDIVMAQGNESDHRNGFRPYAPFVPVIEPPSSHAVLTQHPLLIIKQGIPQNVPIIAGFNAQEGIKMLPIIRNDPKLADYLNNDFELCIPSDIEYPYGSIESKELARTIKQFYFNNQEITNHTKENFVNMITDTMFSISIDSWIQLHKSSGKSNKVYYYVFDFVGDLNWFRLRYGEDFAGTAHMDQASYMFVTRASRPVLDTVSAESKHTMDVILGYWTSFIKYGNPSATSDCYGQYEWTDYGPDSKYLALNNQPRMVDGKPIQERISFWQRIYNEYEQYVGNGGILEAKLP
ncbi:hypothetical protein JYU34_005777 [Plutella xylostella]|uniref:Carboxylic ester hydrolase n=1 Tax=Plutella xylostella TaxID=51655 RepID=A0ABQ7QU41_PLUXY|nr:hypothetical protein JYU34_005777 [Plutella xylostella]